MGFGRPSKYTQELANEICTRLGQGESLRSICRSDHMIDMKTFFNWIATNKDFLQQYTIARENQADTLVDEMMEIADDGTNDFVARSDNDTGKLAYEARGEHIQRSRLRIETRKWCAAKMKPKKYGEMLNKQEDKNITIIANNPVVKETK